VPLRYDIRNALGILLRGEFRELLFRIRARLKKIDLRFATVDELGLSADRSHDYAHSGGVYLEEILNAFVITPGDAIVDFGAGKGGALMTFAKYPFAKITGIEIMPELAAIAESNFRKLNISNVNMVVCDAAEFTDLDAYNYCYFFSPFPRNVLQAVLQNLKASLQSRPRRMHLIYCNPEFHDTMLGNGLFRKAGEFHHSRLNLPIIIYSNES